MPFRNRPKKMREIWKKTLISQTKSQYTIAQLQTIGDNHLNYTQKKGAMDFTSFSFFIFLPVVVGLYWIVKRRNAQNILLLLASYFFYGCVHPWFCFLISASTVFDYACALAMEKWPGQKKSVLVFSLLGNLGFLATFKYFNFFIESFQSLGSALGLPLDWHGLEIMLPIGISFYTFQTLSYTIDVYRGQLKARKNLIDFALFVTFFPQLVAGPIERVSSLLGQIENDRKWNLRIFLGAFPLFLLGYLKKLLIADNMELWVDKIFTPEHPSIWMVFVGSVVFAMQIFADFSAYIDIARGSAKLLGFELNENYENPILAISPADFWRKWYSASLNWIGSYAGLTLSRSLSGTNANLSQTRSPGTCKRILGAIARHSGLSHAAAWNFILWGIYHAVMLFIYHTLGWGGKWLPIGPIPIAIAWASFQLLNIFGWTLFRCPNMLWLKDIILYSPLGLSGAEFLVSCFLLLYFFVYSLPWLIHLLREKWRRSEHPLVARWQWATVGIMALLYNRIPLPLLYFQF